MRSGETEKENFEKVLKNNADCVILKYEIIFCPKEDNS